MMMMIELSACLVLFQCIVVHCEHTGSFKSLAKSSRKSDLPLWKPLQKTYTQCVDECYITRPEGMGIMWCNSNELYLRYGYCMTWDNATLTAQVGRCAFIHQYNHTCNPDQYSILRNSSGSELNHFICSAYNRRDVGCRECIDGYGPAVFYDDISCADCSKHRQYWIIVLFFQLTMLTLMYILVILFRIKRTTSPLNVVITYCQLIVVSAKFGSGFYAGLVCSTNRKVVVGILTLMGVFNLDFFSTSDSTNLYKQIYRCY